MVAKPDPHIAEGGDVRLHISGNAQATLLRWLEEQRPSAHSDVGSDLLSAVRAEGGDFLAYSPSFGDCRYIAIIRARRVCALAHGQKTACFCVRPTDQAAAIALGGRARPDLGEGWISFELYFRTQPTPDLRAWLRASYATPIQMTPDATP